jgi:hypothetical protein
MTVFDTARAYGDNGSLLARGLRRCGADAGARIVTKGGMTRAGGGWIPDGRAKAIHADCEARLAALAAFCSGVLRIEVTLPSMHVSPQTIQRLLRRPEGPSQNDAAATAWWPRASEVSKLTAS